MNLYTGSEMMGDNTIDDTQVAGHFNPKGLCQLLMYKMTSVVRCGYLYCKNMMSQTHG